MNEEKISQIKNQLKFLIQQITEVGEEPPEFIQDLLLKVIEKTKNKIEELRREEVAPANDAQLLWILSGQQPQAFISYLRTYPTPATRYILSNPSILNQTIQQLSKMLPPGEPLNIDGVPKADLNSSNIWGATYDPRSGKMRVRFQGGSEYEYSGIPQNIFRAFIRGNASAKTKGKNKYGEWWPLKNPSLGAAMNQYIKQGGYPYQKIK